MEAASAWEGGRSNASHRQAIERVIRSMHHSLETGMSLEDMSRAAFISPFHFNRIFRRLVGIPPSHFLGALRMQAAKRLLASTEERIIDVGLDVGFSSPGTFSRRFKDLVGLGPLQFRRLACRVEGLDQHHPRPRLPLAPRESPICGDIGAPEGFSGPVFIGLFETPLPQSRPVGCCYLDTGPGRFTLPPVPDGKYYLLALGFPDQTSPSDYLLAETALRAGSTNDPISIRDSRPTAPLELHLRSAEITDPPTLVTIPWLMG